MPGVVRRYVAFWLDFLLAMTVVAPVTGILPVFTERTRTGIFQWNFERTTHAPGDGWLVGFGVIIGFLVLVFYYSIPLTRRRPSPGSCIIGYQIIPDDGVAVTARTALFRTLLGLIAVGAAFLPPFVARNSKKGKFWLDTVFDTHAVMLS